MASYGQGDDFGLGAEAAGQFQALEQALFGQLRAIGGNQDARVHGRLLWWSAGWERHHCTPGVQAAP